MKVKLVSKSNYKELERLYKEFEISDDGDICIAVGGDGTFVGAAREYEGPILPIRTGEQGSLGFCADVTLSDIDFVIKSLKIGKYIEERVSDKLEVSYNGRAFYAVNEALLKNVKESVYFRIYKVVDERKELYYNHAIGGDGLLVSTAFGSTAYNRNAGGAIMDNPDCLCIKFLNCGGPFSENPLVVHKDTKLYIEVVKGRGQFEYDNAKVDDNVLCKGDGFYVHASDKQVRMIRFPDKRESFADKMERLARHELFNNI